MVPRQEIARLLKEAAATMKRDMKAAIVKLDSAYSIAREAGDNDDTAVVAEELARAWRRRKSPARSLHYASKATKLAPGHADTWATLAKTCEFVASHTSAAHQRRACTLFENAATAFEKSASLTTDPEDKRWLKELAGDAEKQAKELFKATALLP